jgi:AcrR family transcriptional regulator
VEVACQVFAQKGFDGATLQDIADQFGVLKGSLFHYISSKDDLLYEIIDGAYRGAEDAIWSILGEGGSAASRLRRFIVAYVRYITEHQPAVTVWLHDLNALEPERRQLILARERSDRGRLIDLLRQAQREGTVGADVDPGMICFALLGSMNAVHRWFRPGRLTAEQIGEQLGRMYVNDTG